jgi:ABC-type transporter Mla subunit MlaD
MAQRDEGLDKLESFIAATAEARAALQRDAEKVADVSEEIEDVGGRIDDHMRNLGATAREIDAVIGPIYQLEMELVWTGAMTIAPGAGWTLGHVTAVEQRRSIIAAADTLEHEYEAFGERRQQAADALEQADAAAGEASEAFQAAAHAIQEAVQPLADSVSASIDELAQVLAENLAED